MGEERFVLLGVSGASRRAEVELPYQRLINHYLRNGAASGRRLSEERAKPHISSAVNGSLPGVIRFHIGPRGLLLQPRPAHQLESLTMGLVSDPNLRAASRETDGRLLAATRAAVTTSETPKETAHARRGRSRFAYGSLFVVSVLLALRVLASLLAEPLEGVGAADAPTWQVQVSTNSSSPGIVLAYGPEVGVQLLRVPSREASVTDPRVIPARLARGELHLITLSLNSLHVDAPGAPGTGVVRLSASSPIITVFQSPNMSGVRTGW
ncbi:hypothetical protein MASR1M101_23000 [Gemmatimonas sp.]